MSGGGSETREVKTEQTTRPHPEIEQRLVRVAGEAEDIYDQMSPLSYFPQGINSLVAPQSPWTQAALAAQTNRAMTGNPALNAAQQDLTRTVSGDYLSAGNPYFSGMADRVIAKAMPAVTSRFADSGRLNSGLASRGIAEGVTAALGDLAYKNYDDERGRMLNAQMFAPQMATADYQDIAKLAEVGAIQEDLTQQRLNEQKQASDFDQMEPWQRLGLFANMVNGIAPTLGGTTTGNQRMTIQQPGTDWTGMIPMIAGMGLKMAGFSDVRLKTDIAPLGKRNGVNWYSYRYKGTPQRWAGVIAQEVRKTHPHAVIDGPYLRVDYGAL